MIQGSFRLVFFLRFYFVVSLKKCIFALGMVRLKHIWVWLNRINHSRGFGIQSPTDYAFVRYVINEHWPYYQYDELGKGDDWLTRKLGRLYFRIANWRQPKVMVSHDYQDYLHAGCDQAEIKEDADKADLIVMKMDGDYRTRMKRIYQQVSDDSILIVEGIWKDMDFWREVAGDERSRITFDLYYCGLVMFDKKRHKMNYIINF